MSRRKNPLTSDNIQTTDDLLSYALSNDIIKEDEMHEKIMASKIEKIKKYHPYAITAPSGNSTRWRTSYIDECTGKRKDLKAKTEEELLEKLADIYFSNKKLDNLIFADLFKEWLEYKRPLANSDNTIFRYEQIYRKYLMTSPLNEMKIKTLNSLTLEYECNLIVKKNNLCRKTWVNIKTILNGMFWYAYRNKYTEDNLIEDVVINVKFKQVNKKTGKTQTYNTDEIADLDDYLDNKYKETADLSFLAVKLNFLIGLRVGELVALKWEDYEDKHLHIVREEIRIQRKGITEVTNHTKTNQDRFVALVPKAIEILNSIPRTSEYIFTRDGERITARQINYVLEKFAERNGTKTKSSHKMRKTYASRLNANGVPLDYIREQLGHSELATTLGYLYNPLTEAETYELLTEALS